MRYLCQHGPGVLPIRSHREATESWQSYGLGARRPRSSSSLQYVGKALHSRDLNGLACLSNEQTMVCMPWDSCANDCG